MRATSARPSRNTADPRRASEVVEALWLAVAAAERDDERLRFKGPPARSLSTFPIRKCSYTVPLATYAPHRPFALEAGAAGLLLNAARQAGERLSCGDPRRRRRWERANETAPE